MRKDEILVQKMHEAGVTVLDRPVRGYKGLLVRRGPDAYVFLSPRMSSRARAVILAEEYAHYELSAGDTVRCSDPVRISRSEERALRRAVSHLLCPADVIKAIRSGAGSLDELAETLDLPCAFLDLVMRQWRVQHGSEIVIDNEVLNLDPLEVKPRAPAGIYAELE